MLWNRSAYENAWGHIINLVSSELDSLVHILV